MNAEPGLAGPDLSTCDREPIHIPGSIQPHGALLAFDEAGWRLVSASANAGAQLGRQATALAGLTLDEVLGPENAPPIKGAAQLGAGGRPNAVSLQLGGEQRLAVTHRHARLAFVELEPVQGRAQGASAAPLLELAAANRRLQLAGTHAHACHIAAEAIRAITGFDRVMIYRFAADWSGEVLGEARDASVASYLGLHFPASDIPAQARALYLANPVRLIPDADYIPCKLVPSRHPDSAAPIDLSFASLRSVSPIHLEYLQNMGVAASMSVSIIRNGALWGLAACHHQTKLFVGFELRQACELMATMLAGQLGTLERVEMAARGARVTALHARMLQEAASGHTTEEGLVHQGRGVQALVEAGGWALVTQDRTAVSGEVPDAGFLRRLAQWIRIPEGASHFATDRLSELYPPAGDFADMASGLLAVSLAGSGLLLWFRPEQAREVSWAGEPSKAARIEAGQSRLHPRLSFASWTERVRGRALPWTAAHIAAAVQFGALLVELSLRERDALERRNLALVRNNQELETFIYVASHDIKEPLRQMEMLAGMMAGCAAPETAEEASGYAGEFRVLSTRLRRLTEELANFARPGRPDLALARVSLGELAEEALAQLRTRIAEAEAEIALAPLPVVLGERAQLHQVFINLLGNALKYREPGRRLRIAITAEPCAVEADGSPMVRVVIADNGIGFDQRHAARLFEAFVRLHPRERYEGSGLGLAICQRIVRRHGGQIQAEGEVNQGARFSFTLSLAPEAGNSQGQTQGRPEMGAEAADE